MYATSITNNFFLVRKPKKFWNIMLIGLGPGLVVKAEDSWSRGPGLFPWSQTLLSLYAIYGCRMQEQNVDIQNVDTHNVTLITSIFHNVDIVNANMVITSILMMSIYSIRWYRQNIDSFSASEFRQTSESKFRLYNETLYGYALVGT